MLWNDVLFIWRGCDVLICMSYRCDVIVLIFCDLLSSSIS